MASLGVVISPFLLLVFIHLSTGDEQYTHCAYTNNPSVTDRQNGSLGRESLPRVNKDKLDEWGDVLPDNHTMRCLEKRDSCFNFWSIDPHNKSLTTILKQGCWDHPDPKECGSGDCKANSAPSKAVNNSRFCCCRGNMCNSNYTDVYVPGQDGEADTAIAHNVHDTSYKTKTIVIALSSVLSVAVVIVFAYLFIRLWFSQPKDHLDPIFLNDAPSTPSFELDDLKLEELIEKGRYGEVWKGTLDDMEVAVKVFHAGQRQYYINERDIYKQEFMDHDSLPRFFGADERITADNITQYLVVMSYISEGTLCNYLKHNSLDWSTLCRMCHSIASGLAHLHTDITKGDKTKPAIAHRDFNTRNILVKPDLSCCICDLGFAMKIMGHKFIRNGHEENAEQTSLTDVGTLRYMAPEVLEGAVNLRDCESSLKQIDVYSLGLVFWEVGTRCSDLYQGLPTPEYQQPFQAEVGLHPTFEDMQLLVSKKKARPAFPEIWKDTNQAIRALKETIDDCWDQDAEARLTALCVEERVMEMTTLWETRHKGVTPTLHTSCLGALEEKGVIQRNATASSQQGTSDMANTSMGTEEEVPSNMQRQNTRISFGENSLSAASTVETVLSPSEPSEPVPNKSNRNAMNARNSRVWQPHQGQNPTMARNTLKLSDEELAILGNKIVDKSVKEAAGSTSERDNVTRSANNSTLTDELLDAIADNLESSLVQNDILNHQQRCHPKPYVLNHVNLSEPMVVRPKQPNVPGNGSAGHNSQYHGPCNINTDAKPKLRFGKNKKQKSEKDSKGKNGGKLRFSLFGKGLLSKSNHDVERGCAGFTEPSSSATAALLPGGSGYNVYETKVPNTEVEAQPLSTEVCMVNGLPVVRPTTLPLGYSNVDNNNGDLPTGRQSLQPASNMAVTNHLAPVDVEVPLLQSNGIQNGQPGYANRKSHSSVDLSPSSTRDMSDIQPYARPNSINSLPHYANTATQDPSCNQITAAKGIGMGEDTSPKKNERYSWCSSQTSNPGAGLPAETSNTQSAFSLQQFGNVDSDMNIIHAADYRC